MISFLTWSVQVRDQPWSNVEAKVDGQYQYHAFAEIVAKNNTSLFFMVPYEPFYYVELPYEWSREQCLDWYKLLERQKMWKTPWPIRPILFHRNRQPLHTCRPMTQCTVVKFVFRTIRDSKEFAKFLLSIDETLANRIWETGNTVPDTLKIAMTTPIKPCEWASVSNVQRMPTRFTKHCDEYFVSSFDKFQPCAESKLSLTLLSVDLEVYSATGKFPVATHRDDLIINIGNSIMTWQPGAPPVFRNVLFCVGDARPDDNDADDTIVFELRVFSCEQLMLEAWRKFAFDELDVDILTGYNIFQFDFPYLMQRAQLWNVPLTNLGRKLQSYGSNLPFHTTTAFRSKYPTCPLKMDGRVALDMMGWIKKLPTKFKSYKLDTVAETLINRHKLDISAAQIFEFYRTSPEKRYKIARYCIVDNILVLELILHQNAHMREMAMAKHTRTELATVITCGQQMKCFNLMMCFGYQRNYVCNYTAPLKSVVEWIKPFHPHPNKESKENDDDEKEKFEGATVISPQAGYYRTPIIVLDFASKYPTIMRSHNLCSSTFIGDESKTLELEPWLKDVPKKQWPHATHVQFDATMFFHTFWKLSQDSRFQNPDDAWHTFRPMILKVVHNDHEWSYFTTSFQGLSSEVITHLFAERTKLKKQLKQAKAEKKVLDAQIADADQGAVKVVMNSLYGMNGADPETARLPCRRVAMSVTSIGREELEITKTQVERHFDSTAVVYGDTDSAFVETKLDTVADAWALGERIATFITHDVFHEQASLALEKVFRPLVLSDKKKCYTGAKFTDAKGKPELHSTGTISNRGEFCDVEKMIFETMVQYMIMQNDVLAAYRYLFYALERLANGAYPFNAFLCRQKLSDKHSSKAAMIRTKMEQRMPGSEPRQGDIVPFVYVRCHVRSAKAEPSQYDHVDDPGYVQANGLVLDLAHYIQTLQVQIEPYFMCFPLLHIDKLFSVAKQMASRYKPEFMTLLGANVVTVSNLMKILYVSLKQHVQMNEYTQEEVECILQMWQRHVVDGWTAMPTRLLYSTMTLRELEARPWKNTPAVAVETATLHSYLSTSCKRRDTPDVSDPTPPHTPKRPRTT